MPLTPDYSSGQRIAIVGGGIAGLTCAYLLHRNHDVHLFEANTYLGGHTHTWDVSLDGREYAVDTGFIVFNDWTYPNFIELMRQLDVASQPSTMSFSVQSPHSGLEYNGTNFNGLFAQRRNLVNPRFLGMLRDILRFNREATEDWREGRIDSATRLGDYLEQKGYGEAFKRDYILPMVAAIWSCGESSALNFPFPFFARFFANHGMLSVNERPEWRVIRGGSRRYVERLQEVLGPRVQLNTPVHAIRRSNESVAIQLDAGEQRFDQVILACHSDQALDLLADATATELGVLGQMTYQDNSVVLHTDIRLLPRNRRAWAAWNYRVRDAYASHVALTYNMNILQNLQASETFCVSLNQDELIDPARIIQRFRYAHPVYTEASLRAQQRFHEISGCRHRTHFCGAYWFNGFHEDGVNSALRVCREFGAQL